MLVVTAKRLDRRGPRHLIQCHLLRLGRRHGLGRQLPEVALQFLIVLVERLGLFGVRLCVDRLFHSAERVAKGDGREVRVTDPRVVTHRRGAMLLIQLVNVRADRRGWRDRLPEGLLHGAHQRDVGICNLRLVFRAGIDEDGLAVDDANRKAHQPVRRLLRHVTRGLGRRPLGKRRRVGVDVTGNLFAGRDDVPGVIANLNRLDVRPDVECEQLAKDSRILVVLRHAPKQIAAPLCPFRFYFEIRRACRIVAHLLQRSTPDDHQHLGRIGVALFGIERLSVDDVIFEGVWVTALPERVTTRCQRAARPHRNAEILLDQVVRALDQADRGRAVILHIGDFPPIRVLLESHFRNWLAELLFKACPRLQRAHFW